MLAFFLSLLGLDEWAHSLSEKMQSALSESTSGVEARLLLAKLELQEGKRILLQAIILLLVCACIGFVLLLLTALALIIQFWDTPYRSLIAWAIVLVLAILLVLFSICLIRTLRRSKKTFELTLREFNQDWQALKELKDRLS